MEEGLHVTTALPVQLRARTEQQLVTYANPEHTHHISVRQQLIKSILNFHLKTYHFISLSIAVHQAMTTTELYLV